MDVHRGRHRRRVERRGKRYGVDPRRSAVVVLDRHLGLAVRHEPAEPVHSAGPLQGTSKLMGKGDRQRHEARRLSAGEAEERDLVLHRRPLDRLVVHGALVDLGPGWHWEFGDARHDRAALGIERAADIASPTECFAGDCRQVEPGRRSEVGGEEQRARRNRAFGFDLSEGIEFNETVDDGVADLVAKLVRMAPVTDSDVKIKSRIMPGNLQRAAPILPAPDELLDHVVYKERSEARPRHRSEVHEVQRDQA